MASACPERSASEGCRRPLRNDGFGHRKDAPGEKTDLAAYSPLALQLRVVFSTLNKKPIFSLARPAPRRPRSRHLRPNSFRSVRGGGKVPPGNPNLTL